MPPLVLVADEVKDPWHWFWRLKDDRGTLLAHHEVALDPADWRAQAFTDLYRYVRQHADPGRWTHSTTELLGQVGGVGRGARPREGRAGDHQAGYPDHGPGSSCRPTTKGRGSPVSAAGAGPCGRQAPGAEGREPGRRGPPGRGHNAQQGPHGQAAADAGRLGPAHRCGGPGFRTERYTLKETIARSPAPAGTGNGPAHIPVWRNTQGPQDDPQGGGEMGPERHFSGHGLAFTASGGDGHRLQGTRWVSPP